MRARRDCVSCSHTQAAIAALPRQGSLGGRLCALEMHRKGPPSNFWSSGHSAMAKHVLEPTPEKGGTGTGTPLSPAQSRDGPRKPRSCCCSPVIRRSEQRRLLLRMISRLLLAGSLMLVVLMTFVMPRPVQPTQLRVAGWSEPRPHLPASAQRSAQRSARTVARLALHARRLEQGASPPPPPRSVTQQPPARVIASPPLPQQCELAPKSAVKQGGSEGAPSVSSPLGVVGMELEGVVVRPGYQCLVDVAADCQRACTAHKPIEANGRPGKRCNTWVWCGDQQACGGRHRQCWLKFSEKLYKRPVGDPKGWTSGRLDVQAAAPKVTAKVTPVPPKGSAPKPAEPKPPEPQQPKVSEPKPVQAQPVAPKPLQAKPVAPKPLQAKSVAPTEATSTKAKPTGAQPQITPVQTTPKAAASEPAKPLTSLQPPKTAQAAPAAEAKPLQAPAASNAASQQARAKVQPVVMLRPQPSMPSLPHPCEGAPCARSPCPRNRTYCPRALAVYRKAAKAYVPGMFAMREPIAPPATIRPGKNPCWAKGKNTRCLPAFLLLGVAQTGVRDLYARISASADIAAIPFGTGWFFTQPEVKWQKYMDITSRFAQAFPNKLLGQAVADGFDIVWQQQSRLATPFLNTMAEARQRCLRQKKEALGVCMGRSMPHARKLDAMQGEFNGVPFVGQGEPVRTFSVPQLVRVGYADSPAPSLIVMLRLPWVRMHSAYWSGQQYRQRYNSSAKGEAAWVDASVNSFLQCEKKFGVERCALSFESLSSENEAAFGHCDQLIRGLYSVFLPRWRQDHPRLLALRAEQYYSRPREVLQSVFSFLNLKTDDEAAWSRLLAGAVAASPDREARKPPMLGATLAKLAAFYAPSLKELVGQLSDQPDARRWYQWMRYGIEEVYS